MDRRQQYQRNGYHAYYGGAMRSLNGGIEVCAPVTIDVLRVIVCQSITSRATARTYRITTWRERGK